MEKAAAASPKSRPTETTIVAFEGLSFETPSGKVDMKLGKGHQAIQAMAYGTFKLEAAGNPNSSISSTMQRNA